MSSKKIGKNKVKCKQYFDQNRCSKNKMSSALRLKRKLDKRREKRGEKIIENLLPTNGRTRSGK